MAGRNANPEGLTDKQYKFCLEYVVDLNGKQAALRAGYASGKNGNAAESMASQLLRNIKVINVIQKLNEKKLKKIENRADKVIAQLEKAAHTPITEFLEYETVQVKVGYDVDGKPIYEQQPIIKLKPSSEIDGTLVKSVKMGKYGIEIERIDPLKALELLGRHEKLFTDKTELAGAGGQPLTVQFNIPRPNRSKGKEELNDEEE